MTADTATSPEHSPREGDSREIEWQLAASDLGSIRRWLTGHSVIDGLSIESRSSRELHDIYFDTDDWRVYRAGYALRTRRDDGTTEFTLKSLQSARARVADRRELSEALRSAEPEALGRSTGPVASRVRAVVGMNSLRALFEVHTRRQRFAIRSAAGDEELGEIALDDSVILRSDGEPAASLRRVEVEALGDRHEPLERVVELLRKNCALEAAAQSKYELGLTSSGLAPATAPRLGPVEIDASMLAGDVALARLRALFTAWLTHEPGARLGDDPERLHELRTAARSIEATLGFFAEHLPRPLVRSRRKLKGLLRVLGAVRDLDVQLAQLADFSRELPATDRDALEPLRRHLESERARARSAMLASLDAESTRRWLDEFMALLARPASSAPRRGALAVAVGPQVIERRFRRLRKACRRLTGESSVEDYHAARSRAKKLRYAIEALAPIYGRPARRMLRRVHRLQNELGRQQDAHVTQQHLAAVASAPTGDLAPRTVFLMGRFAERCAMTGVDVRERLARRWRRTRGRRWKELRARLHELRERPPRRPPQSTRRVHATRRK